MVTKAKAEKEPKAAKVEAAPAPMVETAPEESRPERISAKLTKDNLIDFASMREQTRKQFADAVRATMASPEGMKALGIAPQEVALIFDDAFCEQIYDVISLAEVPLAQRFLHLDGDIAKAAFTYSAEEKKLLAHPTALVLSKWVPADYAKWKEEVYLIALLLGIHRVKMQQAGEAQGRRNLQRKQEIEAKAGKVQPANGGVVVVEQPDEGNL